MRRRFSLQAFQFRLQLFIFHGQRRAPFEKRIRQFLGRVYFGDKPSFLVDQVDCVVQIVAYHALTSPLNVLAVHCPVSEVGWAAGVSVPVLRHLILYVRRFPMPEISPEFAKKLEDGDPDVEKAFYNLLQLKNRIAAERDKCQEDLAKLRAESDSPKK